MSKKKIREVIKEVKKVIKKGIGKQGELSSQTIQGRRPPWVH